MVLYRLFLLPRNAIPGHYYLCFRIHVALSSCLPQSWFALVGIRDSVVAERMHLVQMLAIRPLVDRMLQGEVANSREATELPRGKTLLQSAKVARDLFHDFQRRGPIVAGKMAPGRIFCMSGPVAHVDDDDDKKEQVHQAAQQYDDARSSQMFHNDKEKASFIVSSDDPKTRQSLGEIFIFNGDIYVGSLQGFLPDGMGKYLWSDGCMYEGEWSRGKKNGKGKMSWPSGDTYEGSFSGGYMHGMGTYTGADGTSYKGNWKMNEKHGFGSKNYANGDSYEGSWKRGVPEGLGRYIWKNGSEYIGDWKGGVMSGRGILSWGTGDTFDGHWLEGMQHGHGVYTWADGSSFAGNWSRGLKDGKGIFYPPGVSENMTFHERIRCRGNDDLSGNDLIVDTVFHQSQISSQPDSEQSGIKNRRKSNYISSAEKLKLAESPIDDSISHIPSLARPWKSIGGSLEKVSPFEFVDRICEAVGHRESDNRGYVLEEQETAVSPIVEREYVHGVLINELVFESLTSSLVKPLKRWHRRHVKELKRPGETIYKGHRSYDLMLKLQLGIRYTVGRITPESKRDICPADFGPKARIWMNFPREGSQLTPPHQSTDFKWKDYCPVVFRHLREMFKIDAADYMLSICGDDGLRELSSPGKSGSVFYLSNDDRFIIKTIRKYEVKSLLEMLAKYYKHVRSNENTLVTKFFGLHRIKPAGGHKVHFVVMGNMFCPELCIHRRFDLKGSSQGRSTDKVEIDETTTLKDLDLDFVFHLEPSWRDALLRQIECDCKFLEYARIMDYSILLGVHFRGSQFPAVFSPSRCPTASNLPCSSVVPPQPSDFERLTVEELASKSLVLVAHEPGQDGSTSGSHVRGSPLRASVAPTGDEEVDLLLPGTARRLRIQLGVNMPARAERKLHQKDDSHPQELFFGEVYDVVLYLGIIDILQEYDIGKKIEHAYKAFQFDASSISAVDPSLYAKRFQDFIQQVFPTTPSKA